MRKNILENKLSPLKVETTLNNLYWGINDKKHQDIHEKSQYLESVNIDMKNHKRTYKKEETFSNYKQRNPKWYEDTIGIILDAINKLKVPIPYVT